MHIFVFAQDRKGPERTCFLCFILEMVFNERSLRRMALCVFMIIRVCVYSGLRRKERSKGVDWVSWRWSEYHANLTKLRGQRETAARQRQRGKSHHKLDNYENLSGANWFTWAQGNDGLPRAGWSPRTDRITRITRKTGTTGNNNMPIFYHLSLHCESW